MKKANFILLLLFILCSSLFTWGILFLTFAPLIGCGFIVSGAAGFIAGLHEYKEIIVLLNR